MTLGELWAADHVACIAYVVLVPLGLWKVMDILAWISDRVG